MRRMNGEGTLRRRADGRWELRLMLGYRDDGKPKLKYLYGRTRQEVLKKLATYREQERCGLADRNYTFDEWSKLWFEHHKSQITETTQENYRYILDRLKSHFAERSLRSIKPFDVEIFLQEQQEAGLSSSYLASLRGMLYQIFHKAEANDLVKKNPVRFADKMRSAGPQKRKEAFTAEEVRLLMDHLPHNRMGLSIRLMLGTGMRTQEILALEPCHIEEDGSMIYIRQAVKMVKGTARVGLPKSQDSYRDIPVPPNVQWCARALRVVDTKFIWEKGKKDTPCNPSSFRDEYYEAISKITGVRKFSPHSCRHTYVSQMQALGVSLETLKDLVGHAHIDMTTHYLHVQEAPKQEAMRLFAEAFPMEERMVEVKPE